MKSDAATPQEYLDALPEDRRAVVAAVASLPVDDFIATYERARTRR